MPSITDPSWKCPRCGKPLRDHKVVERDGSVELNMKNIVCQEVK